MELLDIVVCFLDFQEMSDTQKKTQKPLTDLQVSKHPAQSKSLKARNFKDDLADKNNPCSGFCFRNLNKC